MNNFTDVYRHFFLRSPLSLTLSLPLFLSFLILSASFSLSLPLFLSLVSFFLRALSLFLSFSRSYTIPKQQICLLTLKGSFFSIRKACSFKNRHLCLDNRFLKAKNIMKSNQNSRLSSQRRIDQIIFVNRILLIYKKVSRQWQKELKAGWRKYESNYVSLNFYQVFA